MERSLFRRTFSLKNGQRLVLALVVVAVVVTLAKGWWDSRLFQGYDASLPLEPRIASQWDIGGYPAEKVEITVDASLEKFVK